MEIPFIRKNKNCFCKSFSTVFRYECGNECVVPDTQEDILRILTTDFVTKIRSKEADFERVYIKGELLATVLYCSENGLEKLELTLPVNADIPAGDTDSSCTVTADVKISSFDVRMLNPRKISLNAVLNMDISCYKSGDFFWYEAPEALPEKLMVRTDEAEIVFISSVAEKSFVLEEEYELGDTENIRLISGTSDYVYDGCESVGEKLIVRGHAETKCIYACGDKLKTVMFSIPYSQLFEGGEESPVDNEIYVFSTGEYYEISEGRIFAELHAVVQLVSRAKFAATYASDAYSCLYDTEISFEKSEILRGVSSETPTESLELTCEAGQDVEEILLVKASAGVPEQHESSIYVPVNADVVFLATDDEIYSRKIHGSTELNGTFESSDSLYVILHEPRAVASGSKIEFRTGVKLAKKCYEYGEISMISDIIEGDELPNDISSVFLVRCNEGLWETAKKYRSDPKLILEANGIEDDFKTGKMILVPKA